MHPGLPVGNVPVGEELADHSALGRTASLPNNTGENGMEITQRFPSQARPNASPDTGNIIFLLFKKNVRGF